MCSYISLGQVCFLNFLGFMLQICFSVKISVCYQQLSYMAFIGWQLCKIFKEFLQNIILCVLLNTLRPKTNNRHLTNDNFKCIFVNNKANLRDLIAVTGLVILLKLDSNRRFFSPCDLEIWWMTPKNRAPLLCYFKLCVSFRSYW